MRLRGGAVVCLSFVLAGCTGASHSSTPAPSRTPSAVEGHVSGVLLISAMRTTTTAGMVELDGPVSRLVRVGANGRFDASLPPGQYRIIGHSPRYGSGTYPCRTVGDQPVSVSAGSAVTARVLCVEK